MHFRTSLIAFFLSLPALGLFACVYTKPSSLQPATMAVLASEDLAYLQTALAQDIGASQLLLSQKIWQKKPILTIEHGGNSSLPRTILPGKENTFIFTLWIDNKRCLVKSKKSGAVWLLKNSRCQVFSSISRP